MSLSPRKYIEVHGRPTAAEFHAAGMVAGKTSYELSWEVQSFVPIQEYRLLYRRIDMVSTVQCSTKKIVQPCLCSEFSKFHSIEFQLTPSAVNC